MATIGTFKKSGNEFNGEIVTLSVQAKGVRIVPEANRGGDNAPYVTVDGHFILDCAFKRIEEPEALSAAMAAA